MNNALLSGLSGIRSNQQFLDIIGNNLANSNVPGFKSRRVNFRDVLGQTFRIGSGPTESLGGTNPLQVGRGAMVGSIDVSMVQGSLLTTGRNLDLGIEGRGFFVVNDGVQNQYTRAGSFDLDADSYLVDLVTGYRVQSTSGDDIRIPRDTVLPPEASESVEFNGNLTANVTGPLAEVLQTDSPLEAHFAAEVTGNSGPYTFSDVSSGVPDRMEVRVDGGQIQTVSIPAGTYTAAQLATLLNDPNNGLSGATAFDQGGSLVLRSDTVGEGSELLLVPPSPPGGPGTGNEVVFAASDVGVGHTGSEQTAGLSTDLNDLSINTQDYQSGDAIEISGTRPDGTPVSTSFIYGTDGTTLQDLLDRASSIYNVSPGGASYEFDAATGMVTWTANETGEASFTMTLRDANGNTGSSNWSSNAFNTIVQGTGPDTEEVVATVFDGTGSDHAVSFTFERQDDGSWSLIPSLDDSEGTVLSGPINGIVFGSDGTLVQVPDAELQVQWGNTAGTQTIRLDIGAAGNTDGLTQYGSESIVSGTADGFASGQLASVSVQSDGTVEGFFTNGQIRDLEQLAIATFANPEGLNAVGNGMYLESPNSGLAVMGTAQEGAVGKVVSGSLEASNVDVAEEFVRLIEAQRAFQANARIISTTDEVLAELVNIV